MTCVEWQAILLVHTTVPQACKSKVVLATGDQLHRVEAVSVHSNSYGEVQQWVWWGVVLPSVPITCTHRQQPYCNVATEVHLTPHHQVPQFEQQWAGLEGGEGVRRGEEEEGEGREGAAEMGRGWRGRKVREGRITSGSG